MVYFIISGYSKISGLLVISLSFLLLLFKKELTNSWMKTFDPGALESSNDVEIRTKYGYTYVELKQKNYKAIKFRINVSILTLFFVGVLILLFIPNSK